MQIRAPITPADPGLQCGFDFKRWRTGISGLIYPDGTSDVIADDSCPSGCDDDLGGNDDEDLKVDPPSAGSSIYVLDAPGFQRGPGCPPEAEGVGLAMCDAFKEWLEVDGVKATDDLFWHATTRNQCTGGQLHEVPGGTGNFIAKDSTLFNCAGFLGTSSSPAGQVSPTTASAKELVSQLADPQPEVRIAAYNELLARYQNGSLGEKEWEGTVSALHERLDDRSAEGEFVSTPLLATQLLGELRDVTAVPLLIERLTVDFSRTVARDADQFTPAAQAWRRSVPMVEPSSTSRRAAATGVGPGRWEPELMRSGSSGATPRLPVSPSASRVRSRRGRIR
jgi:hypothetical protein